MLSLTLTFIPAESANASEGYGTSVGSTAELPGAEVPVALGVAGPPDPLAVASPVGEIEGVEVAGEEVGAPELPLFGEDVGVSPEPGVGPEAPPPEHATNAPDASENIKAACTIRIRRLILRISVLHEPNLEMLAAAR